jgi:hypothetical protein
MIIKNLEQTALINNTKYKVKSGDGTFKDFIGVMTGISDNMYEWNGFRSTGDHTIYYNNEWKTINEMDGAIKLDANEMVYDLVNVKDNNSFMSNDIIHHNCQTGDQLIDILDTKTDKKHIVTFKQLKTIIELDNNGIDYFDSKIVEL